MFVAQPLRERTGTRALWATYSVLGTLVVAYVVSLIVRQGDSSSTLVDGWLVAAFELVVAGLCLARAARPEPGRILALVLGLGLSAWSLGDVALTFESAGGGNPPTPSLADAFYLCFYPLAYAGMVLMMRREVRSLVPSTWLDGAVAGLGAAAICACFAFTPILQSVGGDSLALATNLAYPIGDLLLLTLVVGGTAIIPGRPRAPWLLLASACALNAVGDTFNLIGGSGSSTEIGSIFNAMAWPIAITLISLSVWLPWERRQLQARQRTPGFLLPGLGAIAGLTILFVGTARHVGEVALVLATATLVTVGMRLALSVRRLRSITEERHRQSVTDELTGLGNRRHLFQVLDTFFAAHHRSAQADRRLAFLFVDLDRFKEINDSFGHAAGDELLKQLGPRLLGTLRASDVLVRLGGDELGVVLMDTDQQYATAVAQRLTAKLEEPFVLSAVTVHISASIGIAFAPADATDTIGLLRCADFAMYRAKSKHAAAFEIYRRDVDDGGNRLRLVEELRDAVLNGDLMLHYQPQVDLHSGVVSAVEALLRWPHPRLGLVPPLDFLPLAEDAGLMRPLTVWVLDEALAQCAHWRREGRPLAVSVNISASNLLDPGFIDIVRGALGRHRLPASALILEITETTIISDFEACKRVIAQLRDLGLAVSIDDFGAGFTSLAYLGSLAVSELKLDRTFIIDLAAEGQGRDVALVRATIELGHALGLRVVAEGIEDRATMDLLTRAGCDLAQGYFISRPVPATDLAGQSGFSEALPPEDAAGLVLSA